MPLAIFAIIAIVFGIATGGSIFSPFNIKSLFSQSFSTLIAGLGMMFVAAMGGTDITHGSLVALATTFGFLCAEQTGAWAFIPVTILIGALSGLLLGIVNAKFKVPSFMGSLSLLIAYRAMVNLLLNSRTYSFYKELEIFDSFAFNLIMVIVLTVIIAYIFHFTRFGLYVRAIGENENAITFTGVNVEKIKILAFVLSGTMAAVAGIFMSARVGGTNNTMGSGFEMKVMMALFIGGIPVEGGMGTKIHKLLIGVPTINLLENGLTLVLSNIQSLNSVSGPVTQLIRGLVLIAAIWLTGFVTQKFRYGFKTTKAAG